jgi:ribosomal protein S18 acetylase RimI-like enzyme
MAISGTDTKKIIPMTDEYIKDVLAVYDKLRDYRPVNTKYTRHTPEETTLTAEQILSTRPGSELDLSFVYEINDTVVGFVWGQLAYVGMPVDLVGFIHMIIVDPNLQRKGIARELLDAVANRCKDKGVDIIRTVVSERDWDLSNFFHEAGFDNSGLVIYTRTIET